MNNKRGRTKGLSLLEIILTLVLITVGILPIMQSMNSAAYLETVMDHRAIALQLAQEEMELIKAAASYAQVDNYASARANLGGEWADFDREVLIAGDPKEVRVKLTWGRSSEKESLELVTLMADYNY